MADGKRSLKRPAPYSVDHQRVVGCTSEVSLEGSRLADFRGLFQALLTHQGYSKGNLVKVSASQVTASWLRKTGIRNPVIVRATETSAKDLGLAYPASKLESVEDVADCLGEGVQVETWDVATQTPGPALSLQQWVWYWKARQALNKGRVVSVTVNERGKKNKAIAVEYEDEADSSDVRKIPAFQGTGRNIESNGMESATELRYRVLSVPSFNVANTSLEADIEPPTAFKQCDLTELVWPADSCNKPPRQIFLQLVPTGSYKDFNLTPGGASVWFHVITGRKVVALAPPSPRNVANYAGWSKTARNSAVFLGTLLKSLTKVEVRAGDTLLIPGGWLYAVATVEDSIGLQGRFLHLQNLSLQSELACLESHLETFDTEEYPGFKQTMWHTASYLLSQLKSLSAEVTQRGETGATNSCQADPDKGSNSDEVASMSTRAASGDTGKIQVKLKLPKKDATFHPPPARPLGPNAASLFSDHSRGIGNGVPTASGTEDLRRPVVLPTSSQDGATSGLKLRLPIARPKDSRFSFVSETSDLDDISSGEKLRLGSAANGDPAPKVKLKLQMPKSPIQSELLKVASKPPRPTSAACAQQEHVALENGSITNVRIKLKGNTLTVSQPSGTNGHLQYRGIPQVDGADDDTFSGQDGVSGVLEGGVAYSPTRVRHTRAPAARPVEAAPSGCHGSRDDVSDDREQQADTSMRHDSVCAAEVGSVERADRPSDSRDRGGDASCLDQHDVDRRKHDGTRTRAAAPPARLDSDGGEQWSPSEASEQVDGAEGGLSNWELEGLPFLLQMLKGWLRDRSSRASVPPSIHNPKGLVRELELYMQLLELPTTPERNILAVQQMLPETLMSMEQSMQTGQEELEEAGESCLEVSAKENGNKGKRKADEAVDSYRRAKKMSVAKRLQKKLGFR